MGTVLVSISDMDDGILVRRYDGAHPDGPTHQGGFGTANGLVTPRAVEAFRVAPPKECEIVYEDDKAA